MKYASLSSAILCAMALGCDGRLPKPDVKTTPAVSAPDNTGINVRDRDGANKTPINQNETREDVQLSADMVRVSAIALGHPRLAVINGKTVTEGDSITLQVPNATLALILRVAKIGDGSIDLSDGKQMFSAQLTIPSPAKPKTP